NPLALIELPAALTAAQLAGEESLPVPLPVGAGVERLFAGMAARLPDESRAVLVLAAADDTGRMGVIVKSAAALGIRPEALTAAEASGLVRIMAGRVEFRHPLVRSALLAPRDGRRRAGRFGGRGARGIGRPGPWPCGACRGGGRSAAGGDPDR